MSTKILLQKTGIAGTIGLVPTTALPASLTNDARGVGISDGLHAEIPLLVQFVRSTVDLDFFGLEMTLDGSVYVPLAFTRLDTGALISSAAGAGMTLTASANVAIVPRLVSNIHAIRPVGFLSAAGAVGDTLTVTAWMR